MIFSGTSTRYFSKSINTDFKLIIEIDVKFVKFKIILVKMVLELNYV